LGYPEFDHVLLKKLGWWDELTEDEKKEAEGKNWKTDLSGGIIRVAMKNHGCHPFGNAKARAVVWNFPDAVPLHREPLYSPRPDMVAKYPTHDDKKAFWRLPTHVQVVAGEEQGHLQGLPAGHDLRPSGRVRGRRRGDALQPVAGRAAAGHVRRDQPADANDRGIATASTCG
jgi:formate dehydrogenase major subunit